MKLTAQAEGVPRRSAARAPLILCLLLVAACWYAFAPAQKCGFVTIDDADYVSRNGWVQGGISFNGIAWAFGFHTGNWHPLTWLSHFLDPTVFGMGADGPHLTNLVLHTANALLLFVLLRRMTGALWQSAAVAACFALHPLRVESVVWISERKD